MSATSRTLLAVAGAVTLCLAVPALADAGHYEFQPVSRTVKNGPGSQLEIRLVDKRSGKPVSGAVIFRTRLDMSPDSMGEMEAKHTAVGADETGIYRFSGDLTMAGRWALTLQAKVPGEAETVQSTVVFEAKD